MAGRASDDDDIGERLDADEAWLPMGVADLDGMVSEIKIVLGDTAVSDRNELNVRRH